LIDINIRPKWRPIANKKGALAMTGITLTADQICKAPIEVRRWIEQEVIAGL
jgi:hypothetical protein